MSKGSMRPTKRQKTPLQGGTAATPPAGGLRGAGAKKPKLKVAAASARPRVSTQAKPAKAKAAKPSLRPQKAPSQRAGVVQAARGLVGKAGAPATPRERRERYQLRQTLRVVGIVVASLVALALVAVVVLFSLRDSSVFSIDSVEVQPTEHVTQEDLQNLVKVPAGSTLLNVDTASIEAALKKDPWIASVEFERAFPHTLKITVHEQRVDALVVMSSGSIAWYLGGDGRWVQPTSVTAAEDQSVNDAALERAMAEGCLLITDVPATVAPEAGSAVTDASILAVQKYREGFSEDFASQVVSYSAPAEDSISCTLASGVEVLLGSPTDIATKQGFIEKIVEQSPGSLLFINVRVPTEKGVSFRAVQSDNVQGGTGVVSPDGWAGDDPSTAEGQEGQQADQGAEDWQGDGQGETLDQDETLDQAEGQEGSDEGSEEAPQE